MKSEPVEGSQLAAEVDEQIRAFANGSSTGLGNLGDRNIECDLKDKVTEQSNTLRLSYWFLENGFQLGQDGMTLLTWLNDGAKKECLEDLLQGLKDGQTTRLEYKGKNYGKLMGK